MKPIAPKQDYNLKDLLVSVETGDAAKLNVLRRLLRDQKFVELFGGNLAKEVQENLISIISAKSKVLMESITQKMNLLRAELAGKNLTALEGLIIERILANWLHMQLSEYRFLNAKQMTAKDLDYMQQCINRSQKRYLSSIDALAKIRKLALPAIQVNIADKQINVQQGV